MSERKTLVFTLKYTVKADLEESKWISAILIDNLSESYGYGYAYVSDVSIKED